MSLLQTGVQTLTNRLPKVISPRTHAIIDYATAGAFFLMAALFWRRSKRAAISSLACGAVETTTALLTDYPGGVTDLISFETHGKIDAGLAGMVTALPNVLGFSDEKESMFFRSQGISIAAVTGLTDFEAIPGQEIQRRIRRAA